MSLEEQIVAIVRRFVGPAAKDFAGRVSRSFVGVELAAVRAEQLGTLAYWMRIGALKLTTEARAAELAAQIEALGHVAGAAR